MVSDPSRTIVAVLLPLLTSGLLVWQIAAGSDPVPGGENSSRTRVEANATGLTDDPASKGVPTFRVCNDAPRPQRLSATAWTVPRNRLIATATAHHSARDALTTPSRSASLAGTFSYGPLRKDLEGEPVSVWVDDCSGTYRKVATARTDDNGRVSVPIDPDPLPTPGRYRTYFHVQGDGSAAIGTLRVLPRGTELIVFDIDGTLTTDNRELVGDLFDPLLWGEYVPEARPQAATLTRIYRRQHGYQLVYLTARPHWLRARTREWLTAKGMAPGILRMAPSLAQSAPTPDGAGAYKTNVLQHLTQTLGFEIRRAYGNSGTDRHAYEQVGLSAAQIVLVGKHEVKKGAVLLRNGYERHALTVKTRYRSARQPFAYR
ncbi:MAG: HAD family acid phosphatase [Salinibacter sp.]